MVVLCILAFILMVLVLWWLYKKRKMERKKCDFLKTIAKIILIILLVLLILMLFPIYMTFKSSADFKRQSGSNDSSESILDRRVKQISQRIDKVLITDANVMKENALKEFNTSCADQQYDLPSTKKVIKASREDAEKFLGFREDHIEKDCNYVAFFDDGYRDFSRNVTSYMGVSPKGTLLAERDKTNRYFDHIYTLEQWAAVWHSAKAIMDLMYHYLNFRAEPMSFKKNKRKMYKRIENLLDIPVGNAKKLSDEIKQILKPRNEKHESNAAHICDFAIIMCYIAIVVLFIYLIILLCGAFKEKNRNRAMVKPLTCIYITLVILFEIMVFAFFFPFFYGVIDYNEVCNGPRNHPTEKSFYSLMEEDCTDDKKIYTIMVDNKLIDHAPTKWEVLNLSKLKTICKKDCTVTDTQFLKTKLEKATDFPKKAKCYDDRDNTLSWKNRFITDIKNYEKSGYDGSILTDQEPDTTYYWSRKNMTKCEFDYAAKLENESKKQKANRQSQNRKCLEGIEIGKKYINLVNSSFSEMSEACDNVNKDCLNCVEKAMKLNEQLFAYKLNVEEQLKNNIGPCKSLAELMKDRRNEYCLCDVYLLNGIWVGSLLFLLLLFISLLLLPFLIYILKKCDNFERETRRTSQRSQRNQRTQPQHQQHQIQLAPSESIVLSPISLPRAAIRMMRANPNPEVRYLLKKKK
ncbi:uncharacterized protein [Eurosta solidaginis]